MAADADVLDDILKQVNQLSPDSRLRLIQRVTATLIPFPAQDSKPLQFGKYKDNRLSSLEDFAIAEWHPTENELNGE
jgi:hypothetical protein